MLTAVYIKGFKTFARPVRMPLEGGVTAIVGPNGSGKSNVTDAVLFALGEQRPATLRAGVMGDVIFSGSETLAGARAAEVSLVLDNSSGSISLPYEEVSLTRRISRDGDSEYRINGSRSRLADVRAVAGEAGIGRHSILRQGAVDAIVSGGAAACRQALEEAAGLGVFRRRRLSASRRLEKAAAALESSHQLEAELSVQLARIEVEARAAREYRELESRYRRLSLAHLYRLATRGLDGRRRRLEQLEARVSGLTSRETALRAQQSSLVAESEKLEERLAELDRLLEALEEGAERLRTASLRSERVLLKVESRQGREEENRRLAGRLREELDRAERTVSRLEVESRSAGTEHSRSRSELSEKEGTVSRLRTEHAAAESRFARLSKDVEALRRRNAQERPPEPGLPDGGELERLSGLVSKLDELSGADYRKETRGLVGNLRGWRGEIDGRYAGLNKRRGSLSALVGGAEARVRSLRPSGREGTPGKRLYEVLRARPGYETALQAALGELAGGVLAEDVDRAVALLRGDERVAIRLDASEVPEEHPVPGRPLSECVEVTDSRYTGPLRRLLGGIYVVEEPRGEVSNGYVAVTREGLRVTRASASRGGHASEDGEFGREARLSAETARLEALVDGPGGRLDGLEDRLSEAAARLEGLRTGAEVAEALSARASRASRALVSEATRRLERSRRKKEQEIERRDTAERLKAETATAEESLREAGEAYERTKQELAAAESGSETSYTAYRRVDRRRRELQAALEDGYRRRKELSRALERASRRPSDGGTDGSLVARGAIELSGRLASGVRERRERLRRLRAEQTAEQRRVSGERAAASDGVAEVAGEVAAARAEAAGLRDELERVEAAARRAREEISSEWGATLDEAHAEARSFPEASDDERRRLAKRLHRFGDVNLLAISQEGELRERFEFVTAQRADAEEAAAELDRLIRGIDREIEKSFGETFRRVRAAFADLIPRMLEGASGELALTEEGVEIGLRLGRRGWRPITVLSGGERSLLALSFLFGVILSRLEGETRPFCILDEAEAALDDLNLARFIAVVDSYRSDGQFLLVTHQKRTMAAADVLYGVTQDASGATAVVSKRLAGD